MTHDQDAIERWKKYFEKINGKDAKCTCEGCEKEKTCPFTWDGYNSDGDCLASK